MSSHFNYEIDENNLRTKLSEMQTSYSEDEWLRFENYIDSLRNTNKTRTIPQFHLNINRNIIVPVIFGTGILLLAILLFKFISISNPETELAKQEPEQVVTEEIKKPEPVEEEKIMPADTTRTDSAEVQTPLATTVAAQPSATPEPTSAVQAQPSLAATVTNTSPAVVEADWVCTNATDVYQSPNLASKKIGKVSLGEGLSALEETNYYIKTNYDGKGNAGYVRKSCLRKNGTSNRPAGSGRKENKAEKMEIKTVTNLLPTSSSEDKEPELK